MTDPKLFKPERQCCCCLKSERIWSESASIIAVSSTIYLRIPNQKSQLKACRRVQVCRECFDRLIASADISKVPQSLKFFAALRESLAARYSDMLKRSGDQ